MAATPFSLRINFNETPIFVMKRTGCKERDWMLSKIGGLNHDQLLNLMNRVANHGVEGLSIAFTQKYRLERE